MAYVPKTYDPDVPTPTVWMIHDIGYDGGMVLGYPEWRAIAEKHGVVLIAPDDSHDLSHVWMRTTDAERLRQEVDLVDRYLCVDGARRAYVGFGQGAKPARLLACQGQFAALALVSYRENDLDPICGKDRAPTLLIAGKGDRSAPLSGVQPCLTNLSSSGSKLLSYEDHLDLYKTAHRCKGASETRDGCETWTCESEFLACLVDGGRFPPGVAPGSPYDLFLLPCGGYMAESPADRAWEFVGSHIAEKP